MPKGTPVEKMYQSLLAKSYSKAKAAKIAQAKTGMSLMTGKKPMHKGMHKH